MTLDVLVPQDLQRDMLALQLAVNLRPVRLDAAAMARLRAGRLVERRFQNRIADLIAQRPRKPGALRTTQRLAHRRRRRTNPHRNRLVAKALPQIGISISRGHAASSVSPLASRSFLSATKRTNLSPAEHPAQTAQRGRHHLGMRGRLILGIGGRNHFGMGGGMPRNLQPAPLHCPPWRPACLRASARPRRCQHARRATTTHQESAWNVFHGRRKRRYLVRARAAPARVSRHR